MKSLQNKETPLKANVSISAAAIQQHLSKNLSLGDSLKAKSTLNHKTPLKKRQKPKHVESSKKCSTGMLLASHSIGEEKILDPLPKPTTLAERLGIYSKPDAPLSEDEWQKVKSSSNSRNDSSSPCAICQEQFALQPQVLLSCSHVFHHNCLQSFERLSGKKSCPMCRKEKYQSRLIFEGAKIHLHNAATKLQACWRGYLVHRWYTQYRAANPPNDTNLRRKFYESKLEKMTNGLLNSVEQSASNVDALMSEIDSGLHYSRRILGHLDTMDITRSENHIDWMAIQMKALKMDLRDCPICLMPINEDSVKERPVALLSCAHLFHYTCLKMFEDCELFHLHHCPVCRHVYTKKKLGDL